MFESVIQGFGSVVCLIANNNVFQRPYICHKRQINDLVYFISQVHMTKGDKELLFARSVHAAAPGGMVELWKICDSLGRGGGFSRWRGPPLSWG